jgi:hypothetical protein
MSEVRKEKMVTICVTILPNCGRSTKDHQGSFRVFPSATILYGGCKTQTMWVFIVKTKVCSSQRRWQRGSLVIRDVLRELYHKVLMVSDHELIRQK